MVMGVSFILFRITTFEQIHRIPANQWESGPGSQIGSIWLDMTAGLTLLVSGAYALFQPVVIVRWNARILSRRTIPNEKLLEWRIGAQVLGGAAVLAGMFILFHLVYRMPR
jgi:hypothetical protein